MKRLSDRVWVTCDESAQRGTLALARPDRTTSAQLDACDRRLRVGLLLAVRTQPIDVSTQPTVLAHALRANGPSDAEEMTALTGWLRAFCERFALWACTEDDLVRLVGGASFPLLGQVYDRGATTIEEIPRWAVPALAADQARAAARAAFGTAATAPVTAALAASLVPAAPATGPPVLHPLALAAMGHPVIGPDQLARVLRAGADAGPVDPADWPSIEDLRRFQHLAPDLGRARVARLLSEAAARRDGPALLARTTRLLTGLPSAVRTNLPSDLDQLHVRCLELTPVDPHPARERSAPPPTARAIVPPPEPPTPTRPTARRRTAPSRALAPPPAIAWPTPPVGATLSYRPAVWALHGSYASPTLRLVLPRSVDELRFWGRCLHNCLGTFAGAAADGQSVLVGVERRDSLAYCTEWSPGRRSIRQMLGARNRAVPAADAASIVAALLLAGLIDRHERSNRPWLDLLGTSAGQPSTAQE